MQPVESSVMIRGTKYFVEPISDWDFSLLAGSINKIGSDIKAQQVLCQVLQRLIPSLPSDVIYLKRGIYKLQLRAQEVGDLFIQLQGILLYQQYEDARKTNNVDAMEEAIKGMATRQAAIKKAGDKIGKSVAQMADFYKLTDDLTDEEIETEVQRIKMESRMKTIECDGHSETPDADSQARIEELEAQLAALQPVKTIDTVATDGN